MLGRISLSVALSVLVHLIAVVIVLSLGMKRTTHRETDTAVRGTRQQRVLRITKVEEEQQREDQLPFAKTDPNREEQTPTHADFVGARDSVQSASEFAPKRRSDAPLPTQNGEDSEEVVTFSQRAQKGPLENAGSPHHTSPPLAPPAMATAPLPMQRSETGNQHQTQGKEGTAGIPAIHPPPKSDRDTDTAAMRLTPQESGDGGGEGEAPIRIQTAVIPSHAPSFGRPGPVYDPSLADSAQPLGAGFRTYERLTRSTGKFVVGSRPSLNVASTPRGRYEEEIYRRIAYFWYRACDEHRGDIIPGSVVVSLRLNADGLLENMELVRRRGASMIQQSFTFGAIRSASLPPMPPQVQREIHGDLLELIFTFNFD